MPKLAHSIVACLLAVSSASWACTCISVPSLDQAVAESPLVLHVRVTSLSKTTSENRWVHRFKGKAEVIEVIKGGTYLPPAISIKVEYDGSSCSWRPTEGAVLLVFLREPAITTSDLGGCSASRLLAVGDPLLEKLRKSAASAHSED